MLPANVTTQPDAAVRSPKVDLLPGLPTGTYANKVSTADSRYWMEYYAQVAIDAAIARANGRQAEDTGR